MSSFKEYDGIKELVKAGSRVNHNRNRLLTIATAIAIVVLFSAFSIAKGKVVVDSVRHLRENGSAASAYLENGWEGQYEKLKELDYVEYVGQNHVLGKWYRKDLLFATCEVIDKMGYEKIVKPAYDGIVGRYPESENEIMLSRKLLERIGITHPQLEMEISVPISFDSWSVNDGYELTEKFVLSGYYNEYTGEYEHVPAAYFSDAYLETIKMPRYPARLLIKFKSGFLSNAQIERRLYQDVSLTDEKQQFIGIDSGGFQAVEQFMGGYGIAVLSSLVVLLSVYLLIYNVLSISFTKDIRYYGLLFTIGLTQIQIKKVVFKQNRIILIKGIFGGIISSLILGYAAFPALFQGLFLQQKGNISAGMIFYPEILAGVVLFVSIVMLTAGGHTTRRLKKLSPIEAYRYQEVTVPSHKHKKKETKKGASIARMARYNLFRSKRKFFVTLLSLFLGCEMALLTVFITNGADIMNELLQKPDFKIGTQKDAAEGYLFPYSIDGFHPDTSEVLLDGAFMEEIINMDELDKSSVAVTSGYYGYFDYHEKFIQPSVKAAYGTGTSNTGMTIQVADDDYIHALEDYVKSNQYNIDIESLRNGQGILVLHKHELSEMLEDEAEKMTGEPAHVYGIDSEYLPGEAEAEFTCSGYLDTTKKGFPHLDMSWNGDGINYFLISEKGAEKIKLQKQVFDFTINAKEGKEAEAKSKLTKLIQEKNGEQEAVAVYYLSSTSDKIVQNKNYVNNSRAVMAALCLSLFLLGIANYFNVIVTGIVSRKKEFAIMQSIGMTKKQLKQMLMTEGVYCWAILMTALLSVGTLITLGTGIVIKGNLSYFRLIYPVKEFMILSVFLLAFCTFFPQVLYKKDLKKSAIEQLRNE